MPEEDVDDPLDEGTPPSRKNKEGNEPPKPSRTQASGTPNPTKFNPRYLKDAEKLGIPQEEIDACASNGELRDLLEYEQRKVEAARPTQPGRGGERSQQQQQPTSPPPPPPPEPDWALSEEFENEAAPSIKNEIKRLGKELVKATKRGDEDRIESIEKKIDALAQRLDRAEAANSPTVRKINKVLSQYEHILGTEESREDDPEGDEAWRFRRLDEYMRKMKEQGRLTNDVAKDLQTAIGRLFPGAKPGGTDAAPDSRNGQPKPAGKTRADDWRDAGTPPTSHRNSADQSNKPGGKRGAAAKVRETLREQGYDTPDDSDDLDDDGEI